MDPYFATLFDKNYLLKGTAMVESLLTQRPNSKVAILSLDLLTNEIVRERFNSIPNIHFFSLKDLDSREISKILSDRKYNEFCWTLSSLFTNFILHRYQKPTIYLDADIYFFHSPHLILDSLQKFSLGATPHRFSKRLRYFESSGIYNVQFVFFNYTDEGIKASNIWRDQCLSECVYDPKNGKVGDQKYLDEWPKKYEKFFSIDDPGFGLAPWNHEQYKISWVKDIPYVDDKKLIFYHFHQFKIDRYGSIITSSKIYQSKRRFDKKIYEIYINHLSALRKQFPNLDLIEPEPMFWRVKKFSSLRLKIENLLFFVRKYFP